jgi:2-haloacid dehalogenase
VTPGAAEQGRREQGRRTAIFDLGGVVLSWDPVRAFSAVVDTDAAQRLMRDVDFSAWNRRNDAGRRYAEGEAEIAHTWPEYAQAITAYRRHFDRTLTGTVPGTSAVVAELARAGVRLLGLTNWSDETFPVAQRRFGILRRLEAIVVSGREGLAKPDPRLYRLLLDRYAVDAASAVFVDDNEANCAAAAELGLTAIRFVGADDLRARLVTLGLLAPRRPVRETILHIAERRLWDEARHTGSYPWSSHGTGFEAEGFVHLAYRRQVPGVLDRYFSRFEPEDLVLLELDPERAQPVVDEGSTEAFPHLYAPLTRQMVVAEHDVHEPFNHPA